MPPRDFTAIPTLDPVEDITRRQLLTALPALGVFAAGISCGDEDDAPPATLTPPATRQFTDSTGYTQDVPARPQRIVATHDLHGASQVLSLGLPLAGLSSYEESFADYITRYFDVGDARNIGYGEALDIEGIVALEPDLILSYSLNGAIPDFILPPHIVEDLRSIAPVVAIDPFRPVDTVMAEFTDLLGVAPSALDKQRDELDGVIEEMRTLLGTRWSEVTVGHIQAYEDSIFANAPESSPVTYPFSQLGVDWIDAVRAAETDLSVDYSLERMSEFDCDLLLYVTEFANYDDLPLFQQLAVVKGSQVVRIESVPGGTDYVTYTAVARDLLTKLQALPQPIRTDIV